MERVDVIASGYEWICPQCDSFNKVIAYVETVECRGCNEKFETNMPEHCFD